MKETAKLVSTSNEFN